ncbi:MAG: hypothetical protein M3R67_13280 [Acidobacteriota bacterium]|nr:hypothetical protein [Acidobacteriota bacterium]
MRAQKFNWQIWAGFLLSVGAFLSYPFVFVRFPITRDFPWANLLLLAAAVVLLFFGIQRAFASDQRRPTLSRIVASTLATLGVLILGFFVFSTFIMAKWLPRSQGAPQIGQKAPDFSLTDTNGKVVSLSDLSSAPISGRADSVNPKGVLLIFYRGYW